MISRRGVFIAAANLAAFAAFGFPPRGRAAGQDSPAAVIGSFYETLLAAMKNGPALGFAGRRDRLAPAIQRAFNLPLMTRLMVGPPWQNLTQAQRDQLVKAFINFSVAIYASRFDDYSGESFQVDPSPTPINGGVIVRTKLNRTDGEPVQIDYLMRQESGAWQIVDVYLSGTVSELATRRSEFSSVLRRGGPDALVEQLQRKTAQLSS